MLKVVHASWHKKSWVENNSRKDTVEIRETERIEHGETKEEKMFAAFLRATMTFQEVRSKLRLARRWFDWRATLWNRKEKTGRVLNLTRIPEVFRYFPFVLQNMVFRSWDFFVFPKIYWLIDMYTIMHNEKMGKIQQVQNNHLPETFCFQKWPGSFWFFWMLFLIPKMSQTWKLKSQTLSFLDFFSRIFVPFSFFSTWREI